MKRSRRITAALCAVAGVALWLSCRYDPVPQEAIYELPAEDAAGPSAEHRPGQPCVLCHSAYEGAEPELAIGGTIYDQDPLTLALKPVEGVFVTIFDSNGAKQKACSNSAGNFFVSRFDWPDAAFPLTVKVGNRVMRSLIGRDRSCASCHRLATQARIDDPMDNADPSTGASRDSAGAILVDPRTVPVEEQCGPNPASAVAAGAGGGGAAGGANAGGASAGGSDGAGGAGAAGGSGGAEPSSGGNGGSGGTQAGMGGGGGS